MLGQMGLPTFRQFLELPISVRHAWDGYGHVDQALIQLEQGNFYDAALLSDAVYTDDRVLACLTTRVNGLFGLPLEFKWPGQEKQRASFKPSGEESTTQKVGDPKISPEAQALKQRITRIYSQNFEKIIPGAAAREQMRWGILLNAGVGELIWDWGSDGLLWPTMKTWSTQFLWWRYEPEGKSSYWVTTDRGPVRLTPGDGRWVLFAPTGHNHGWLYGLIRALGKLWLDRVFAMRDSARASEKYSLGVLLAKMPSNAAGPDKQTFLSTVTNMPNESLVFLPQGAKKDDAAYDLAMMQTDQMVHPDFHDKRMSRLDSNIAVCILGQNLTTEIKGTQGAKAAQVHDNVRGDYLKADDEIWASMVRTQISTPWTRYNFADEIEALGGRLEDFVPDVRHAVDPPDDQEKRSTAVAAIASAIPDLQGTEADIHALLEEYGIPTIDVSEDPEQGPGADVNERPKTQDGVEPEGEEKETLRVAAARRSNPKPGQRKGRVVADELVDAAKIAATKALEAKRKALLHICMSTNDYDEMKQKIRALYWDAGPSELRGIVEKALATAQLVGRLSAAVDHRHG